MIFQQKWQRQHFVKNMKLVKSILIVLLICLCQALQNFTETDSTEVSVKADEEFHDDPYIHKLNGKCSFMLRIPGNKSHGVMALTEDSAVGLLEQICQGLKCGGLYHVNKTSSTPNITCFHNCLYQDLHLKNCSLSKSNCTAINEITCGHQNVRLAGGSDRCAGRVELWRDGKWGTVCDDEWDLRDADVVCAQLDCGYALNVTRQGGVFPPGRGPVHLDELNCTGKEDNLWSCPAAQDQSDCGHKEDAGVICSEMKAIRLTGGLDRCSGKVEIHRNGSWGTVCDNCWNINLASMVCSMLQCGTEPVKFSQFVPPLTHNNGTLWFYMCPQNMQSLWECRERINKPHLCAGSKASGVICKGSLGFPNATTTSMTGITSWTTKGTTRVVTVEDGSFLPTELLGTITLSLLLLLFLIITTVLCCHYKRRYVFLLQRTHTNPQSLSEHRYNSYQDSINLTKVTANTQPADVPPSPRYLWNQLSSVDITSVNTDYEHYEPSNDPSTSLSTFRNSQRYKTDTNSLMKPSGADSHFEEGIVPANEVMGTCVSTSEATEAQYARVSKISVDSFDTSSTSSGECYENTNGYVVVMPEAASKLPVIDFSTLNNNDHESGDGDDDPVYSPVSPDEDPLYDDDYDDVGS